MAEEDTWIPTTSRTSPIPPALTPTSTPIRVSNPFQAIIEDEDDDHARTVTPPPPEIELVSLNGSIDNTSVPDHNFITPPRPPNVSNISTRTPAPATAPPADDFFDIDIITMPTVTANYLPNLSREPIKDPNYLSICNLERDIANELANTAYGYNNSGLSVIAEDATKQRVRKENPTGAFHAEKQPQPVAPTDGDTVKYRLFLQECEKHKLWNEGTRQTLDLMVTKVPVLAAKKNKTTKAFPETFSVVNAFTWLKKRFEQSTNGPDACSALQNKARALTFTLNPEGMITYFGKLEEIKNGIDTYNKLSDVDDPLTRMQMVAQSQRAATKCGLRLEEVRKISAAWKKELADNGYNEANVWEPFMDFFDAKLCTAFKDYGIDESLTGRPSPTDHANLLSRLTLLEAANKDLDRRATELAEDNKTLESNQFALDRAMLSQNTSVPSVVGTNTDTMTTSGITATPAPAPKCTPVNVTGWRQWTFFCYTCGVNLNHNTDKHPQSRAKREGHDDNLAATHTNLNGGNGDKNWLWKLYCEPDQNKPHNIHGVRIFKPKPKPN